MKPFNLILFPFLNPSAMIFRNAEDGGGAAAAPGESSFLSGDEVKSGEGESQTPEGGEGGSEPKDGEAPKETKEEEKELTPEEKEAKEAEAAKAKEEAEAAAKPIVMEDLEIPEGLTIPEEVHEEFLATLNNPELTQAQRINTLLKMQGDAMAAMQEDSVNQWMEMRAGWRKESESLPEIGGDNSAKTIAEIKKGIESVGMSSAYEALDITGAGDHPKMVQLLHKLVQPFLEKTPTGGEAPKTPADRATRMYPSMNKKD